MDCTQLEIPGLAVHAAPGPRQGGAVDVGARRQELLELLFHVDGRGRPGHPYAGVYTGLAAEFHRRVGQEIVDGLLESSGFQVSMLLGGSATAGGRHA